MDVSSPMNGSFEYEVIGEHLSDPRRLLAIDTDGHLFDLDLETCIALPTELSDAWVVDTVAARRFAPHASEPILPSILVVG